MSGIWREPDEESIDLYPGLVVHDGRVTGSITLGRSRLPLWAFVGRLARDGWEDVTRDWDDLYGWDAEQMDGLLYDLFELRGEFARLLLILADAERREGEALDDALAKADTDRDGLVEISLGPGTPGAVLPGGWWEQPEIRDRVAAQLRRCLATLESTGGRA